MTSYDVHVMTADFPGISGTSPWQSGMARNEKEVLQQKSEHLINPRANGAERRSGRKPGAQKIDHTEV